MMPSPKTKQHHSSGPRRKHKANPPHSPQATTDESTVYAALDLGTNNCRLLVAKSVPGKNSAGPAIKVIDSFSKIVRLGEGVSKTGTFSEEAMERTLTALRQCKQKLDKYAVARSRFVATEACRRALNTPEFLARVEKETGVKIDIISNEEEARLAFLGCASLLNHTPPNAIVFDIGGGSTEFMWVDLADMEKHGGIIRDWKSIECGVMNLSEKFGGTAFSEMYYNEMVNHLAERLRPFDHANNISAAIAGGGVQMLSTSGTVTTLAAIHLGLPRYERAKIDGITLKLEEVREATRKLLHMRPSERFLHPCIGSDRADYILSGCAIFEAICSLWPIEHITIADRGVREGIILSLMQAHE